MVTSSKLVLLRNKLWKEWNYGKTGQEKYPEAKKKGSRVAFQAKSKAERRRFGNAMQRDNKKYDVFKIEKKKANHEQAIKIDDGVLAVIDSDKKVT